uniref:Auxin response factor domain-containing protein n=1 Tax=Arundo donax TaxID=35708 RepID=A0A0A9DFB2_ARUDO
MRSFNQPFSVGMRFKMRYESEGASERRCSGIIIGSREADPMWHGSKWKCLVVRWDDVLECRRPNKVSPWEIELIGSVSGSHLCAPSSKRLKPCLPNVNPGMVLPNGSVSSDFAGSARFHKVLQGQEVMGFKTHDGTAISASQPTEARNFQYSDERSSYVNMSNNSLGVPRLGVGSPTGIPGFPCHCSGFGESQRFQKVLQGQEVFHPFRGGGLADAHIRTAGLYQPDGTHASGAAYRWLAPQGCDFRQAAKPVLLLQSSSPSSVLMFPQISSKIPHAEYEYSCLDKDVDGRHARVGPTQDMGRTSQALSLWPHLVSSKVIEECVGTEKLHSPVSVAEHESNNQSTIESGCRIFGVSLAEKVRSCDEADSCNANCNSRSQPSKPQMPNSLGSCWATVHKQRPVVGRVVDVSAMDMMI